MGWKVGPLCCLSFPGFDDRPGKARLSKAQSGEGDIPDGICVMFSMSQPLMGGTPI